MPSLRGAVVDDDSSEFEFVVVLGVRGGGVVEVLGGVLLHVEVEGEGAVVVDFVLAHCVVVELEAFEDYDEDVRQGFETDSFDGFNLLFATLAVVGVVALEHLALDVALKGLLEGCFVLDVEPD